MAAWPWQAGGAGASQPAQASSYWGNQSYATNQQQAQYQGMPQQSNYQAPTGGGAKAPNQQSAWSAPSQSSWGSAPTQQSAQPQQSASSQTPWSGQGGWGQPQQPTVTGAQSQQPPPSWWQQGNQQPPQGNFIMAGDNAWQQYQQVSPTGVFPGGQPPPQNSNTDGYQMPQFVQKPLGNAMPGWDQQKWMDPTQQTPKYVVGRILQGIPARTDQMDIAVARLGAAYPGTKRIGQGDVSIPGVGNIDILQSAGSGGKAWQWFTGQQGGQPTAKAGNPLASQAVMDPYTAMLMQLAGAGQAAQPQQQQAAAPAAKPVDVSQYTNQIQQLQTQLAELQNQMKSQNALKVNYF